jgi:hypothetical protein
MLRACFGLVRVAIVSLGGVATGASANTIVVDVNGSGQFTDIPPAIVAAQDGDTLLVLPGSYSGFTLDKGLFIIGYGSASAGVSAVVGLSSGFPAAVVHFAMPAFSVDTCQATVIVQELTGLHELDVSWSSDVRIRDVTVHQADGNPGSYAMTTLGSRVELATSTLQGSNAPDCVSYVAGGPCWAIDNASRVHAVRSGVHGGDGSSCSSDPSFYAGYGSDGIDLSGLSQLILAGGGSAYVGAGYGGINWWYQDCSHDASDGCAIVTSGQARLWYSLVTISSGYVICSYQHCTYCPLEPICGFGSEVMPEDPTLEVVGNPAAGQTITFTLYAPAGSSGILYFGRQAILVPDTNPSIVEQLTPKSRIVNLGTIPAAPVQFSWPINAALQPGTLLIAQSEITLSGGAIRRTNSVPVIVR